MSAKIECGGKMVRPNFNHGEKVGQTYSHEAATAQLSESIRNVLEDIAKTLRRIDRRMAKKS